MRAIFTRRARLTGIVFSILFCGAAASAAAQDILTDPRPPKPTEKRPPTNRKPRRAPQAVQTAPLGRPLEFQWWLLKTDNDGKKKKADIGSIAAKDRFLLSIKIVEDGYLYVIRQPSPDADGNLIFPSKYYNRGEDRVRKDDEFILPDCSNTPINMLPSVTNERLIVILSRKPIRDLPPPAVGSLAWTVKKNVILGLRNAPGQQPSAEGSGKTENTYFMEANSVNIEKIIETLAIINGARVVKVDTATVAAN